MNKTVEIVARPFANVATASNMLFEKVKGTGTIAIGTTNPKSGQRFDKGQGVIIVAWDSGAAQHAQVISYLVSTKQMTVWSTANNCVRIVSETVAQSIENLRELAKAVSEYVGLHGKFEE